jgi:Predicted DNA binding protein
MLVTPLGLLFEFISGSRKGLDVGLFDILLSGSVREMMDYMLTPREQEVLYYAYFRGYYSQPHSVTLDRLAEELGVSKSALSEILRSAERKIVSAYMRHDLPHLIVSKVLERALRSPDVQELHKLHS